MLKDIKSLAKHSSIYGISNMLQKGIGFIMIPVYTHYLTVSDYGILELMDLTVNIVSLLIGVRLGSAIIRYYHHYENPEDKLEVFSTALIFVSLLTIAVVAVLEFFTKPIAGLVLGSPDYFRYFQIIFVSMGVQTIASVPESYLLARKESFVYSSISIGTLISYLSFNILFIVVYRMGIMGMLLSMIITKVLNTSSLLIIVSKQLKLSFSWEKLKNMLKFGLPLVPESFCLFIMHYSDRFFVQKFCQSEQLGQYSLGYKFGMLVYYLISEPFFSTWNTQRFEIAKQDDAKSTFARIFTYYSAITIFVGLGISVFIDEVIRIMTPESYQGATTVVAIVVSGYIFLGMANFFNLGIMVRYKTKFAAYIQMIIAGLNLMFNWFFISRYGVIGAAFATMLSFFCLAALTMTVSQHLYPVPFELRRVLVLFITAAFVYGISRLIHASFVLSLSLKSALLLVFPALLFVGRFFTEDELEKAQEIIKARLSKYGIGIR